MKQNKYDDSQFFSNYSQMERSVGGLEAAGEWPVFKTMLPELGGKKVLDLGCGFGWHCRYAREKLAKSVVGVDISEKMLERARGKTADPNIVYQQIGIEDIHFDNGEFDVVLSSLAFHYVNCFEVVCRKVHDYLVTGGEFVFSVEHPIFTSRAAQDWHYDAQGEKMHWPIDDYHEEGARLARFLEHDVVKYHRSVATYVNTLIEAGFQIAKLSELEPTKEMLENPAMIEEKRRPMFLLIAAVKH